MGLIRRPVRPSIWPDIITYAGKESGLKSLFDYKLWNLVAEMQVLSNLLLTHYAVSFIMTMLLQLLLIICLFCRYINIVEGLWSN